MSLAARTERYAVGLPALGSLVAGRASYRLVGLAAAVALLPIWGEERYGVYAAATASFGWLAALVVTGPEKTILKLRPRAPRVGAAVTAALLAVLWWAPLPLAGTFLLVLATGGGDRPTAVYLGVAAASVGTGCLMLLVGLHRAAGRTRPDALVFLTLTLTLLILLGAAGLGVGPVGYLAGVVAVQSVLAVVLTFTLGRPSLRIRRRPRLLARLGWTSLLLGSADLSLYLTAAVLFIILAAAHPTQVGRLFVVSLLWSAGTNLLLYVLRVYAPRTSLRLAGSAGWTGRARAAQVAGWVVVADTAWLVAAGAVVPLAGLAEVTDPLAQTVVWAVLLTTRAPAVATLLWASYQLENTDATAPRVVGLAAAVGVAIAGGAGLVAVPAWGGVGLVVATTVGQVGYALVLAVRGRGRRGRR